MASGRSPNPNHRRRLFEPSLPARQGMDLPTHDRAASAAEAAYYLAAGPVPPGQVRLPLSRYP